MSRSSAAAGLRTPGWRRIASWVPNASPGRAVAQRRARWPGFAAANLVVLMLLGIGVASHPGDVVALALYVQLVTVSCALPLLWVATLRGGMALLLLLFGVLFVHFGLRDLVVIVLGLPTPPRSALLTPGELAALATLHAALLGYLAVAALGRPLGGVPMARDWSPPAVLLLGLGCWATGCVVNIDHLFTVADLQTGEVYTSPFAGVISLLRFLQPIGSALLVYRLVGARDRSVLPWLLATLLGDLVLGFLGDSKEVAFRGVFLLLIGYVLLRDRIPLVRAALLLLLVGASFSYFAAYRDLLANTGTTRVEAVGQLDEILGGIAAEQSVGKRIVAGLDYFSERTSLKGNIELIVARTGVDVPFRNGDTLVGVLYTFLPRYFFPDKPDTSTGRLFNAEFQVSAVATTYISQGINGEFYWNFGWPGLLAGMISVGALLAAINRFFDLDQASNAPRFLVLIVTAYLLCLRFEGNVATEYTYWLRAMLLLVTLHVLMPKLALQRHVAQPTKEPTPATAGRHGVRPNWVALDAHAHRRRQLGK